MKIIYNRIIPPTGYSAINLFGIVFIRKEYEELYQKYPERLERTIRHESIHTAQMKELLWLFFYLWYGIEWVIRIIQYWDRKKAYYNISFEREAYANEMDVEYLKKRKFYSLTKYIFANKRDY